MTRSRHRRRPPQALRLERLEPRQVLAGEGLFAEYFDDAALTAPARFTRTDATVNFDWGTSAPSHNGVSLANTTYSVRWTGAVVPEHSERYTFTVTADDGVRLWVDDQLIITNWVNQSPTAVSGQIALQAGRPAALKLEYYQNTGAASVQLAWSSPSRPLQVIPQSALNAVAEADNRGTALQETWLGVGGSTVAALTPTLLATAPAYRQMVTSLQSLQQDVGDSTGTRVRGFIVPSFTGPHVFSVAGNDDVQLSLSPDATPANAVRVAFTSAITAPNEWSKTATQTSAPIQLVQGRRYYFEVLHKEVGGYNHWSVGWTTPASSQITVIGSDNIEPWGATTRLPASGILDGMSTGRDRILASPEMFARARALVAQGGSFRTWYDSIKSRADFHLLEDLPPTVAPTAAAGGTQSTLAGLEDNLTYLAGAYRLVTAVEGSEVNSQKYFDKAKAIIQNVIQWSTWDTGNQFLGAAMVSQGISICYDWMYSKFTSGERQAIATALYNLAIKPTIDVCTQRTYWTQWYGNWAFVCIGGVGNAALAIAPEYYKAEAETLIARGWPVLQSSMQHFAGENGGWHEGPGYMGYGTLYLIRFMSNLQTAVGTDFSLSLEKGFSQLPTYLLHVSTNVTGNGNNGTYPYSNGDWSQNGDPWFFWLAQRFNSADVAKVVRDRAGSTSQVTIVVDGVSQTTTRPSFQTPWSLLWHDPRGDQAGLVQSPGASATRTDANFYGDPALRQWGTTGQTAWSEHVNIWRDSWNSTSSAVMFKGGYKGVDSHDNLDGGSFIFDALGQRWATDLGRDAYSFARVDNTQYNVYRKRAEGHNTLVINPTANDYLLAGTAAEKSLNADQVYKDATGKPAYAPVVKSLATDLQSVGVVDLTNLYSKMRVSTVQRGFLFDRTDGSLLVQDEITAAAGPEIYWFMHVPVRWADRGKQIAISADGKTATITIGSNRLQCRILSGTNATFSLMEAKPLASSPAPSGQSDNSGVTKLTIRYTGTTSERLTVWLTPLKSGQAAPATAPAVTPLVAWAPKAGRQAWAGDIDAGASVSAADRLGIATPWAAEIAAATGRAAKGLDDATANRVTPVTLSLPLNPGEQVTWAKLVAAVRATSGTTGASDLLYFDSPTGTAYSAPAVGWGTLDTSRTAKELTLSAAQLASLQDGTLNLAFSPNTTVDWVQLQYATADTGDTGVVTVASGQTTVDSLARSGSARLVKRGGGTLVLTAAATFTGGTVVEEGELVIRDAAALGTGTLTVRAGATVRLDVGYAVVPVVGLTLDAAGLVDVGTGKLAIAAAGFEAGGLRQQLLAGHNGGGWNGSSGIVSSRAPAGSSWGVGYRIAGGVATVGWAAVGDANLDGQVNIFDVQLISTSGRYNQPLEAGWEDGDFNYDGRSNVIDLQVFTSTGLYGQGSYLTAPVTVTFTQTNGWASGSNGEATIRNVTATPINGWTLEFELVAEITNIWNATIVSRVGNRYVIRSAAWNPQIAAGGQVSFGFEVTGVGWQQPSRMTFNGMPI